MSEDSGLDMLEYSIVGSFGLDMGGIIVLLMKPEISKSHGPHKVKIMTWMSVKRSWHSTYGKLAE